MIKSLTLSVDRFASKYSVVLSPALPLLFFGCSFGSFCLVKRVDPAAVDKTDRFPCLDGALALLTDAPAEAGSPIDRPPMATPTHVRLLVP